MLDYNDNDDDDNDVVHDNAIDNDDYNCDAYNYGYDGIISMNKNLIQ
jgi:hypothetical protein